MGKFKLGDRVRKISGSNWKGVVVGTYSTTLTPEGYAVESDTEKGSVQIYPAKALEYVDEETIVPLDDPSFLAFVEKRNDKGREWIGLSPAEIMECMKVGPIIDVGRAIESKLKEKNA